MQSCPTGIPCGHIRPWGERAALWPGWNAPERSHTFNRPWVARRVIGLIVPGTDTFAIDVSLGQRRKGSVRRGCADVVGIETRAVMFGGPKASYGLVGECDGGLVVADPCGEGQCPRLRAIERTGLSVSDLRAAQYPSGAVDQQGAQAAVAALGDLAQPSLMAGRVFDGLLSPSSAPRPPSRGCGAVAGTASRRQDAWRFLPCLRQAAECERSFYLAPCS